MRFPVLITRASTVRRSVLTAGVVTAVLASTLAVGLGLRSHSVRYATDSFGAFSAATELRQTIPTAAVLDPNNASLMKAFAGAPSPAVVNTGLFGVPIYVATQNTPRHHVKVLNAGLTKWGSSAITGQLIPIPTGARPATGSDGKLVVIDEAAKKVFDLWQASLVNGQWQAGWGSVYPFDGDALSHQVSHGKGANQVAWPAPTSRATGSGLSSLAGLITASDMRAGVINHALVFSSDFTCGPRDGSAFRFPATATDGLITGGPCLPEGSRIRLDPTLALSQIPGITAAQLTIGYALQKYGAYLIDSGGSRLAIVAQTPRTTPDTAVFDQLGMSQDYYPLTPFSLSSFQLLASWNGK
jgi:hypothetical protein